VPHSHSQNHIHLVFSTKDRAKIIYKELQPRLWAYVAATCKNQGMLAFAIGGMSDHIHVLFRLPPTITLVRAVTLIKSNSSKWVREKENKFEWQEGYGAFSVSSSGIEKVIQYIDEQEQRHRKFTFEQEYLTLLKKQGISFDPKNIFG
jgi:putative transposase